MAPRPEVESVVCIVTPVFNGAAYIDDTIYSILSQAGDFVLRYHVQDGGSLDDTMERVEAWIERSKTLPCLCRRIEFTCSSEPDEGMYDAINKAFAHALPPGDDVVMGWIAADDRVAQGACATIFNVRAQMPHVRFMGGRVALLDQSGSVIGVNAMVPFSRRCMAAGLYDGRALTFVMQEGTFWCADLWRKVGGLDPRFKLGGDWDLWRRMAGHEAYVSIDGLLGFHRRRPGQLSEHMADYYQEIDAALDHPDFLRPQSGESIDTATTSFGANLRDAYKQIAVEYELIKRDPPRFRVSQHAASAVRYNLSIKAWEQLHGFGMIPGASKHLDPAGVREARSVLLTDGFKAAEGPYPEYGMQTMIRWVDGSAAAGEVRLDAPGLYRTVVRCRSWTQDQSVIFTANHKPIGRVAVTPSGNDRDIELSAQGTFTSGLQTLGLVIEQPSDGDPTLLVIDWWIEQVSVGEPHNLLPVALKPIQLASRAAAGGDLTWPRISLVVPTRNYGRFIRDTLNSIVRQCYPNLELIVVDGASCDETSHVLREFAPYLTHVIVEPDKGQSEAINKGFRRATGDILSWLNSDDLLAAGALYAIAHAFTQSGADIVAGVCEIFDDGGRTLHRHLPCLNNGPFPFAPLLDLENHWLRGQFFHQPEVFFSRVIWERAGGFVDEALYYSMDYDLWVRMAQHGATIQVIGTPIAQFRTHSEQKTSTPEMYRPELTEHSKALREASNIGAAAIRREVRHRLNVVMFNDYGFKYGAGIAHRRLATALLALGHEVTALAYSDFDRGQPTHCLSSDEVASAILAEVPDLIFIGNLHSIAADFDLLGSLRACGVPVVFYAHDQWIVTGRCAYPSDCPLFLTLCDENCPTADHYPRLPSDQIAAAYRHKRATINDARESGFAVFTNSQYMKAFLHQALAPAGEPPIHVAPIGIDTQTFDLGDQRRARMLLDLPQHAFVVLTAASSATDARKGLPLLLAALDLLHRLDDVVLLVMGFDTPIDHLGIDIRVTGYLTAEDMQVLHYQAADVFVGPSLAEAFGQTFIEAACCGVPSIAFDVGGVSDAIVADLTGILVTERSPHSLAHAIEYLQMNPLVRRRLGFRARLHGQNNYSIEASAAHLTRILATEAALGLNLAPNVSVKRPFLPLTVRYLLEPSDLREIQPPHGWIPRSNLSEEWHVADGSSLPARFWWATGAECSLLVRANQDGAHTLQLSVRNQLDGQNLTVTVNDGTSQLVAVTIDDFDILQQLQLEVELFRGLNRIVIGFGRSKRESSATQRDLALLLENVATWPGVPVAPDALRDGACEFVQGFGAEEEGFSTAGIMSRFRWALGERCKLRIYSAVEGKRVWELAVRNEHADQQLSIAFDNVPVLALTLAPLPLEVTQRLRFEVEVGIGSHFVTIESSRHNQAGSDPRSLAFILNHFSLCEPDGNGEPLVRSSDNASVSYHAEAGSAPLWLCGSGFSHLEGAAPTVGLLRPFRWAVGMESVIHFTQPMARVELLLHNDLDGQVLEFAADNGEPLCVAELEADITLVQTVMIKLPDGGARSLSVRARLCAAGTPADERQRSFVLDDVIVSSLRPR